MARFSMCDFVILNYNLLLDNKKKFKKKKKSVQQHDHN